MRMNDRTRKFLKENGAPSHRINDNPDNWIWLLANFKWGPYDRGQEAKGLLIADLEKVKGRD